jgi:hypothetical protein
MTFQLAVTFQVDRARTITMSNIKSCPAFLSMSYFSFVEYVSPSSSHGTNHALGLRPSKLLEIVSIGYRVVWILKVTGLGDVSERLKIEATIRNKGRNLGAIIKHGSLRLRD